MYYEKPIKINNGKTKMVAHRGFRMVEVENTIQAFNLATNCAVYGIENDVHLTKDGKFIVIHDHDLKRLAGIEGKIIEEMTFDECRAVALLNKEGVADGNYHMPTVEEYITACKLGGKQAILEIKHIDFENSKRLAILVNDLGYIDNTTFIAFQKYSLEGVRDAFPTASVQYLTTDLDIALIPHLVKNKWDLDKEYKALTKERIDALHELGITINCWTVNEKDVAELLVYWGVDMITSDIFEANN